VKSHLPLQLLLQIKKITKRIQVSDILLRAPLALAEELEYDGQVNGEA